MSSPWRPPGLDQFGALGVGLLAGGASLQQANIVWQPANRIIASEYAGENLFDRIASAQDAELLQEIADLTNPVVQAQTGQLQLVPPEDQIFGHGAGLIMAAFTFPGGPSRFSDGEQGTFYAGASERTAIAETVYHQERFLRGSGPTTVEMTLLHAELDAPLVDIRDDQPRPDNVYHPDDYAAGQLLGGLVRKLRGFGIVYDSVRDSGGQCAALFRPPALSECSPVKSLEYQWDGRKIAVRAY